MRAIRNEHRRRNQHLDEGSQREFRPTSIDFRASKLPTTAEHRSHRKSKENRCFQPLPPPADAAVGSRAHGQHRLTDELLKPNRQYQYQPHTRNRLFEPFDLDVLSSASSSLDSDELLHDGECGELIDLDADYSPTAAMVGGRGGVVGSMRGWARGRPISFYSTSDLTTSDSEIQRQGQDRYGLKAFRHRLRRTRSRSPDSRSHRKGELKRTNRLSFATKFPSLSTIYPDNSSLSFGDADIGDFDVYDELNSTLSSGMRHALKAGGERSSGDNRQEAERRTGTLHHLLNGNSKRKTTGAAYNAILDVRTPKQGSSKDRHHIIEMTQAISPVLPLPPAVAQAGLVPNEHDADLPPVIQPLRMSREWRPIQSSTMSNFYGKESGVLPNANAQQAEAGRITENPVNPNWQPQTTQSAGPTPMSTPSHRPQHTFMAAPPLPNIRSLFGREGSSSAVNPCQHMSMAMEEIRPETFNLPSQLAKHCNIKGILFLDVRILDWTLVVTVKSAAYFLQLSNGTSTLGRRRAHPVGHAGTNAAQLSCSSYVKVEIGRSRSHGRKRNARHDSRFKSGRTCIAVDTNRPDFYEEFKFRISSAHLKCGDKLGITVYFSDASFVTSEDGIPREVLGKMSFSLRKLFRKAHQISDNPYSDETIKVCDGGYFLLPERTGTEGHLSQDNILHRKYYDEIGSSMSTASSSLQSAGSPLKHAVPPHSSSTWPVDHGEVDGAYEECKMMGEPNWPTSQNTNQPCRGCKLPVTSSMFPATGRLVPATDDVTTVHLLEGPVQPAVGPPMPGGAGGVQSLGNSPAKVRSHPLTSFLTPYKSAMVKTQQSELASRKPPRKASFSNAKVASGVSEMTSADGDGTDSTTNNPLDYTTGSSSSTSGIEYKRRHRCTLPSITTTTDTSDFSNGDAFTTGSSSAAGRSGSPLGGEGGARELNLLCPDPAATNTGTTPFQQSQQRSLSNAGEIGLHLKSTLRRVSSFTFSPEHNKMGKRGTGNASIGRKFTLGPLGKTLDYIRHKVDTAISTSSLYPTKEECRQWQDSFESLLNHKYGCLLFRQFVAGEFSVENLDFWLEVQEYKKMKEGKRNTVQKAHSIYDTYVKDGAVKEVNLDSVAKAETRAALSGDVRPDVFNLAQSKIEQLMAKDSYQRFLKSELYLALLIDKLDQSSTKDEPPQRGIGRSASVKESPRKFSVPDAAYSSVRL